MKILNRPPRLYRIIQLFFPEYDFDTVHAFVFGDTIYTKHRPLPKDIAVHESIHIIQMRYSKFYAIFHFLRYFLSKKFRVQTELPAFREQYRYLKFHGMNAYDAAKRFARALSEEKIYGNKITYEEALKYILS